jgi:hypothetical protein
MTCAKTDARRGPTWLCLSVALLFACAIASPAQAGAILDSYSKSSDGLLVYIGLLPAELLEKHPATHPEQEMHDGVPQGPHEYHLVAAVFDEKTGERIENAEVFARISPLGLSGPRKELEPMEIAGTTTYGAFFDLPGSDRYTIALEVKRPGVRKRARLDFAFRHEGP